LKSRFSAITASVIFVLLAFQSSALQAAEIVVFATIAAKSTLQELVPGFERDSNHKLMVRYATAGELKADIEKGATCDVALLTAAALDDLAKQGKLSAVSRVMVFRSGVGIAAKRGAPVPTIRTSEELKQALIAARSVAFSTQGATGPIMRSIFDGFGIAETMSPKITLVSTITAAEAVALGQAELAFTQISEILDTQDAQLIAPLPADVQVYSSFAAAASVSTKEPQAVQAFLKALTTPPTRALMRSKGLETD